MTILLIDTSKPTAWVAVVRHENVIVEQEWLGDKTLGVKLLADIEEMTSQERPTRIAVHRGPGHFMAVRAGIVTAQLLAQAWAAELVEITGNGREELMAAAQTGKPVSTVTTAD